MLPTPLKDFHAYVTKHERRLVKTGVNQLLKQVRQEDPASVEWLASAAAELAKRLAATEPVAGSTAYTYASRLRGAVQRYLDYSGASQADVGPAVFMRQPDRRHRSRLTPREQLDEAYAALARWPDLRRFLVAPLVEAENKLLRDDEASDD